MAGLTKEERSFIIANKDLMSATEIAKRLNRSTAFVRKNIAKINKELERDEYKEYIEKLHNTPFWSEVRKGLVDDEEHYFELSWSHYMKQFSVTDILPTDELMIKDLVMLDIMCNRLLKERALGLKEIESLMELLEKERAEFDVDTEQINNYENQLGILRRRQEDITRQFMDLQKQKDSKLKELKATRLERYKHMEETKKNIWELLKQLDTAQMRKQEGMLAEKMRAAVNNLQNKWGEPMEYADGTYDKPLLTADTVE